MPTFLKICTITFGMIVFGAIAIVATVANVPVDPKVKAAQVAKDAAAEVGHAAKLKRITKAVDAGQIIKAMAREPDSIKFDEVRVSDDATIACANYRGRNGFGGISVEHAVFKDGQIVKSARAWNKNCLAPMEDETYAAAY